MAMAVKIIRGGWGKLLPGGVYKLPISVAMVVVRQGYGEAVSNSEMPKSGDKSNPPRKRKKVDTE